MRKKIFVILILLTLSMTFTSVSTISGYKQSAKISTDPQSVNFETERTFEGISTRIGTWPTPERIRIAFYNEPNTTRPSYAGHGSLRNDFTSIVDLLQGAYQLEMLTFQDILEHQLVTANYDVFVLADTLPRENITDLVRDFWLGGGSLLNFDSSANFLCYAGIPTEAEGTDGYGAYWTYQFHQYQEIVTRHPVTKAYQLSDIFDYGSSTDYATFNWTALQETSAASDFVKLATIQAQSNKATIWGYDPSQRGGKVVHIAHSVSESVVLSGMEDLIIDSIEWLCPRPKGRIAFDLSHQPRLGVDSWDENVAYPGYYKGMRDMLVNHSFTFDKLYPQPEGNLTMDRLSKYDMLILVSPDYNYTAPELIAIENWVANHGGGLLVFGESGSLSSFKESNEQINLLLANTGLQVNPILGDLGELTASFLSPHPTTEKCTKLGFGSLIGYVNITGDATGIWYNKSNIHVGQQEFGLGRIILSADINWATDAHMGLGDNPQFALNVANWLTSCHADILLYTDEPWSSNHYRTPVCQALNDLGLSYALTADFVYFNLSLTLHPWNLVIVDNPWYSMHLFYDDISNYLDTDGKLIMSTYRVSYSPTDPLWAKMGFVFSADMPGNSPIHVWNPEHGIFKNPNNYAASNFTPALDYGDEGDLLSVYPNATALAGSTVAEAVDKAVIVLRNDGKTLYNGYLIDQFSTDLDDSTYEDRLELWENEIAFMLRPTINEPVDIQYTATMVGSSITWIASSIYPISYQIVGNGTVVAPTNWDGSPININVEGHSPGIYNYTIIIADRAGYSTMDTVIVTVYLLPTINSPADIHYIEGTTNNEITWIPNSEIPDSYEIFQDAISVLSMGWNGSAITVDIDGLSTGTYNYTLVISDTNGVSASDSVIVTVEPTVISSSTTPTTTPTTTSKTPGFLFIMVLLGLLMFPLIRRSKKLRK